MKEYVLVFAHQTPGHIPQRVILVEKQKPDWQRGRLNLPGGKIEPGETPIEAAARELWEETNIYCATNNVALLGEMFADDWKVHVCFAPYHYWGDGGPQQPRTMTDESVLEMDYREALSDPRLIPNLRLIIPLCIGQVAGWRMAVSIPDQVGGENFILSI